MTLQLDPEFALAFAPMAEARAAAPKPKLHDVEARRQGLDAIASLIPGDFPADVEQTTMQISAADGAELTVYRFRHKATTPVIAPAILHCHAGGMIACGNGLLNKGVAAHVSATGVQTFSVEYRLAPEHPHPTPTEDCYTVLTWVHSQATELGVDTARIAVMGESAGGGIAAGLALMARDRKLSPPLAKQILVYPMLDDRNVTAVPAMANHVLWSWEDNVTGWTALLGKDMGTDKVSAYAAPARATDVSGLPPTYIDVGELDIFCNENIRYAGMLATVNIPIELHVYPGVPHAFEMVCDTAVGRRAIENRNRAIMSI